MTPTDSPPPTNGPPPKLAPAGLSPDEAGPFVGMSRSTLDTYVQAGLVPPPAKVGAKCLFSRAKLQSWIDHGCPPASEFEPIWKRTLAGK